MPSCYIPNKYQVLLDWVCIALSSSERLQIPEDDLVGLWILLKEILQSKEFASMGSCLTIPYSFYNHLYKSLPQKSVYQDDVLTITGEILHQPKLCEMLLSKVDLYISFLSCLLSMLRDSLKESGNSTDGVLVPLTAAALQHFNDKFKFRLVHKKTFDDIVQKLLISCLCIHQQMASSPIRLSVESLLSETLFSKDMLLLYVDFLKHRVDENVAEHKLPQSLLKTMNLLQEKLKSDIKTDEFEGVMKGIPLMYELFLTSLSPKTDVSFAMFKKLLNLIGFSAIADAWEGSSCQRSCVMDCLYQLLLLLCKHNIYSVSDDEASGGKQRIYLSHLISQVIELHQWEQTSWFLSLHLIFTLNHKILEEHLHVILTAALSQMVDGQISDDSDKLEDAKLNLLCEISDTYVKLRQFSKFCVYLLKSFLQSDGNKIQLKNQFLKRFGTNVQDLPPRTSFAILSTMNSSLTRLTFELSNKLKESTSGPPAKKRKKLNEENGQGNALQNVAVLLGTFLRNCQVVEFSAVHQGAETLRKLLQQLVTDIILPSMAVLEHLQYDDNIKDDLDSLLFSTLFLVCCHGDVKLLLHNYVKKEEIRSEGLDTPLKGGEFHFLHDYLQQDTWQRIALLCREGENIKILFMLEKLVMQQIKMLVLAGDVENQAVQESLQNLTSELCSPVQVPAMNSQSSHSEGTLPVPAFNYQNAHLQLLVHHYPILSPYMSEMSRLNFVSLLHQSLFSVQPSQEDSGVSDREIAEAFIKSDMCKESKDLHRSLVIKSLETLSSILKLGLPKSYESHSPQKKRKSHKEEVSLMELLQNPKELHENLKLMASEPTDQGNQSTEELTQNIAQFLKILSVLPIGLLSASQQTDCMMALLVIDFLLNQRMIPRIQEKSLQLLAEVRRLGAEIVKEMQRTDKMCQLNLKRVILALTTSHLKLCEKVLSSLCDSYTEALNTSNEHTCELLFHWLRREKVWSNDSGCVKGLMKKLKTFMEDIHTDSHEFLARSAPVIDISTVLLRFCSKHCDHLPSNFSDFTSVIHLLIESVTGQIDVSNGTTDFLFVITSVTNFFLCLHEIHGDGTIVAKDSNLTTLQNKTRSVWSKMLLSWIQQLPSLDDSKTQMKLNQKTTSLTLQMIRTRIKQGKLSDKVCKVLYSLLGQICGELSSDLQETLKMAIIHMTDTQLEQCVTDSISSLGTDARALRAGLNLWMVIPFSELSSSKFQLVFNVASHFISSSPFLLRRLLQSEAIEGDMVSLLLNSVAAVIIQGKNLLTEETAMSSLCLCSLLPLDLISPCHFPPVFQGVCRLVTNLIVSFHQSVLRSSHCYVTCLQHLLKSVMKRGQQTRNEGIPDEKLFMCAENMERLLTLFSSHKETKQVTGFLVATFIQELQEGTLLPAFKKTLVLGVYNIVASCDFKTQSLFQKTMPGELREVYKSFMQDYHKYHQYKGRI